MRRLGASRHRCRFRSCTTRAQNGAIQLVAAEGRHAFLPGRHGRRPPPLDQAGQHVAPRNYGVDDLPIILQDRRLDRFGALVYAPAAPSLMLGMRGETLIVNGVFAPLAKVPRGMVRLRVLNGANARNFDLRFADDRTFHVIASDGGYLAAAG